MEILKSESLTLAYEGINVIENLNFSVDYGDYLCIIGENGSGKSSLLKAIIGDVQPAAGKLTLDPTARKKGIGYLPQQNIIQSDFPATSYEVVISGCIGRNKLGLFWNKEAKSKADEAMELLGISSLSDKPISVLSGGQRQKVLLARAFCASSDILLLDEPVNGLDPSAAHEMYSSIRMLNQSRNMTIIMVSHDVQCALHEANKILSLCRGHSFFGTPDEYYIHEQKDAEYDHKLHDCTHCHVHHSQKSTEGGTNNAAV